MHAGRSRTIQLTSSGVSPRDYQEYAKRLKRSELFRELEKAQCDSILRSGTWQQRKAGALFFRQGDPASSLHLLASGRVKVYHVASEGHRILLGFVAPGGSFGYGTLVTGAARLTTAEAVLDSLVVAWDSETLARLMQAYPLFAIRNLVTAQERVHLLVERLEEFTTKSVDHRIAKSLVRLAGQIGEETCGRVIIDGNFQLKDLAELTGTTIYTVSRVLGRWRRQGIVAKYRGRLVLSDSSRLQHLLGEVAPAATEQASAS